MKRFVTRSAFFVGIALLLGGCSHEANQALPTDAVQVSSGDKTITCTAPHDGRVFLRDDTDNRIVYSADIGAGQIAKFDPDIKQVIINGTVANIPYADHDHSWFFQRSTSADRAPLQPAANQDTNSNSVPTVHVPVGIQVDVQTRPSR